jgi:hypothetical protein
MANLAPLAVRTAGVYERRRRFFDQQNGDVNGTVNIPGKLGDKWLAPPPPVSAAISGLARASPLKVGTPVLT